MTKNLRILITALMIACFLTAGVQFAFAATAQITTDQKLYSVGQTMNLTGTGFSPNVWVNVTVQRPDHLTDVVLPQPATDGSGTFKASYTPPLIPGRYTITATDGVNTAVTAVTEADAIGYNKGVYNKTLTAPEDTTGNWTTGNAGKAYLEGQWTFYQYQITGLGSTVPSFDVTFNHFQAAKDAVFIDGFANFRACIDCTDSTFSSGPSQGMLLDTVPLPPSDTTNWVLADSAMSHINRPLNSAADGSGSTVLTGGTGFCSSDTKEPIPDGITTFPAEFHCFHVDGPTLKNLFGTTLNSGTHTLTLFFAAHLTASFVWGNGTAGVGGHEALIGDCTSPYYVRPLTGPLSSFEPIIGSGTCSGHPQIYGTDDYTGWTSSLFGVGFASGSSRQFSLTNQSAGPSGAITLPIPTVAAPSNTIVIVKQTVPANATGVTFPFTSSQLGNFSLTSPFPSSKTFLDIAGGVEYDVTETNVPGWTLTNLNCAVTTGTDDGTGTWPINSTNSTAAITLGGTDSGVTLTCTYTNTGTGHIIVQKVTNPSSTQSFPFTTTGTGYTGFSLVNGGSNTDGGSAPVGGLTPGAYTVSESAVAGWVLTSRTCSLTVTGSGTSTFPASGTTQPANITLGAGDTVTCVYNNSQPAGSITVAPSGVNEVNHQHIFTITATQAPNGATPATTANITFAFTPSNPGTVNSTCGASVPFSGNTATCTVTVNNASAGTFTINATAAFTVGGVAITKTTDGVGSDSGPATKRWVDAKIVLSPLTATNAVGQAHTITATVSQDDGLVAGAPGDGVTGFGPAPNGTLVTFTLLNNAAGATFVGGVNTCTTTGGTCSVQINSSNPGGVDIHATTTFSVGGVSLTRATGDGLSGDSVNAHKNYVAGGITVTPTAVNEVGHQHIFTITATQTPGAATPATTANITFAFTPSNPGTVSTTCGASVPFSGNNATCTVTINNPTAATFTINATAVFTVGGVTITKTTDGIGGDSGPATKTYVDANVSITPTATNEINTPHTFNITVTAIPSTATPVVFTSITPSVTPTAGLTQNTNTCASPTIVANVATCTLTINSATAGVYTANVTAVVTMGGTAVTRMSGDGKSGDSGPAVKTYIAPATTLTLTTPPPAKVHTGDIVTLVVTETNTGSDTLTNVTVSGGGACAGHITPTAPISLAPTASQAYTCSFTAVDGANAWSADGHGTDSLNNPVPTGNGTPEHQAGSVSGISPATTLALTTPPPAKVHTGDTVTLVVTETNTGDDTLSNVTVSGGGACAGHITPTTPISLAPTASQAYTCSFTAVDGANAWSADGHGTDTLGTPVATGAGTPEHQAGSVTGVSPATTLTLTTPPPASIEAGSTVTIVVTETNTGDDTLSNVTVSGGGACAGHITPTTPISLAPTASQAYTCSFTAVLGANAWSADGHGTDSLGHDVATGAGTPEHQAGSVTGLLSTLILVKNTVGGNGTFSFSATGSGLPIAPFPVTTVGNTKTITFALIPSGAKSLSETVPTGWLGNTTNVSCTVLVPGVTSSSIGTLTTGEVAAGGTITANILNLGVGATVQCTFTNALLPTLTVVKTVQGTGTTTFTFPVTGDNTLNPTITPPPAPGTATYPPGPPTPPPGVILNVGADGLTSNNSISEQGPPAGWTLTDFTCTGYTGGGTNAGPLDSNGVPTSWNFIAKFGDNVVCTFVDNNAQATRTQGFWATHTQLSNDVWDGTNIAFGTILPAGASQVIGSGDEVFGPGPACPVPFTITALPAPPAENILMGGFWSAISQKSGKGGKRTSIDQARMQMMQQYLAAVLNYHMFGSIGETVLQTARTAYCGTDASAIQAQIGILGSLNQSGDTLGTTPGGSATTQKSKAQADIDAWDVPTNPVD